MLWIVYVVLRKVLREAPLELLAIIYTRSARAEMSVTMLRVSGINYRVTLGTTVKRGSRFPIFGLLRESVDNLTLIKLPTNCR